MRKLLAILVATVPLVAGCSVGQTVAPSPSGPAEQALSIKMTANPDHIVQDGSQTAQVAVTSFDAGGHAIAVQVKLALAPQGFGTLSADTVMTTTDATHPTVVTYIPPASTVGNSTNVTISAAMVGANATTGSTQQVIVTVLPATALSLAAPTAVFTTTPANTASVGKAVTFDASTSCPAQLIGGVCPQPFSSITRINWNFGDNSTGTGGIIGHAYTAAGTYTVTLTVQNDKGLIASSNQSILVSAAGTVLPPTPNFTFSPTAPGVGDTVFFNANTSTAAAGHSIASYAWTFGDGATASGVTASHTYAISATYNVQLTVTDDVGQSTTSASVGVAIGNPPAPSANFTSSPAVPTIIDSIVFDASSSSTAQGQTITKLAWNFGDSSPIISCPGDPACVGTRIITHTYTIAATYVANLVVTDSAGRIGSHNATVTVVTGDPEPLIIASPTTGTAALTVGFNSAATKYYNNASAQTYDWNFGDPSSGSNTSAAANPTHTFNNPGTYTVRLTITDTKNRVGTTTITITVS